MCGPIAAAFSLSQPAVPEPAGRSSASGSNSTSTIAPDRPRTERSALTRSQLRFHLLLNLGRILSYVLVGAGIGAIGSVLMAGGQMAGVGSLLRRSIALLTGGLLIWFGLAQINPQIPRLPLLHPLTQGKLHQRLSSAMVKLSLNPQSWTPFLLGAVWGLIPCGFLYAAQIKAAETASLWRGSATMLAFGLGTLPMMLGVGLSASLISADRRSQLSRIGGWLTLTIGILTLSRTGDTMTDYTGHAALICLLLALAARPLSRLWATPLRCRRVLGVGAFLLALMHTLHMAEHSWGWNLEAIAFMLPQHQRAIAAGGVALLLMAPAALTSFDRAQRQLGGLWRRLHLLTVPALLLVLLHTVLIGSHYLGTAQPGPLNQVLTGAIGAVTLLVLLMRTRSFWSLLSLEKYYVPPTLK